MLHLITRCLLAAAATPRVAVIGGGISGAATAHFLSEQLPGALIDVHEAETRIGGRAHTLDAGIFGVPLDAGYVCAAAPSPAASDRTPPRR